MLGFITNFAIYKANETKINNDWQHFTYKMLPIIVYQYLSALR